MGTCQFACSIFCFVAAVILTVFWLITAGSDESDTNLTFMIVAIKHEWDLKEKSASCRNGAFIYYGLSVVLLVWGFISSKREESRLAAAKRERLSRRLNVDSPLLENEVVSPSRASNNNSSSRAGPVVARSGTINGEESAANLRAARQSEDTDDTALLKGR